MPNPGTITRAVNAIGVHSVDAVFPRVYAELRKLAAARLAQDRRAGRGGGLEPTALVHAAYEKLFGAGNPGWESRRHFFGAAANAMRQILIDQARQRRVRREAVLSPHPATALVFGFSEWGHDELLALDEALHALQEVDPRLTEIVRLRVFADRSMEQAAELVGVSLSQGKRDWRAAKAWLYRRIQGEEGGEIAKGKSQIANPEGGGDKGGPGVRSPKRGDPPKQGGPHRGG